MSIMHRLMELGLNFEDILDIYYKEISILKYGAVIFHNGLTKKQSDTIEAVQRKVLLLFMLSSYINVKFSNSEETIFLSRSSCNQGD